MKKNLYLTIITIVTIICIIFGTCYHVVGGIRYFLKYNILNESDIDNESYSNNNVTLDAFNNIVIDTDVIDITIVSGDKFSYSLECSKKLTPVISVDNSTLNISQSASNHFFGFRNIKFRMIITVPSGTTLNTANITSDVGNIRIDTVNINNVTINTDVGNIDINSIAFNQLRISSDVGNINMSDIEGIDSCNIDITSDVGKISYLGTTYKNNYKNSYADIQKSVTITTDVGNVEIR